MSLSSKLSITEVDLKGKRVLIRVRFSSSLSWACDFLKKSNFYLSEEKGQTGLKRKPVFFRYLFSHLPYPRLSNDAED